MATSISNSPAQTQALGEVWGREAESGWVIGLCGELGAGKTQLVQGLARGLGTPMRAHSPSFVLVNVYTGGRLTLFHLDLYRLESLEQILAAGLEEYLSPAGVTVIEWADRWGVKSLKSGVSSLQSGSGLKSEAQSQGTTVGGPQRAAHGEQSRIADYGSPGTDERSAIRRLRTRVRWVRIDGLSQTERRISYEDFGP